MEWGIEPVSLFVSLAGFEAMTSGFSAKEQNVVRPLRRVASVSGRGFQKRNPEGLAMLRDF